MFRFILYCLIYYLVSAPVAVHADESEMDAIPEPPDLAKQYRNVEGAAPNSAKTDEQASAPPVAAPESPDLPMTVKSGETLEPDITIIRRGEKTIQEYRRNGVIYMVKVIPVKGPAYYLIDINGDGKLDIRGSDLDKGLSINQWKLLEWK